MYKLNKTNIIIAGIVAVSMVIPTTAYAYNYMNEKAHEKVSYIYDCKPKGEGCRLTATITEKRTRWQHFWDQQEKRIADREREQRQQIINASLGGV